MIFKTIISKKFSATINKIKNCLQLQKIEGNVFFTFSKIKWHF